MIFCLVKQLIRFLICFVAMTFVQDTPLYSSVFYPSNQKHKRVAIRHIEGGGVGYNKGYTTLEAFFAPDPERWRAMPFLDLRGHVFNTGKLAVNAGGGVRGIARDRVYGGSVYYDFRNTEKGHYNQMGLGLETLGRRCDVRVNGYLPFKKTVSYPSNIEFAGFQENQMMISQDYQLALRGVNAELGVHCGKTKWVDFYAAVGPYYFSGKDKGCKFWGGKARLMARIKENWTLELSNSYDKVFHDRFQCQLTFNLPFGSGSEEKDEYDSRGMSDLIFSRMVQPLDRQEIIVEQHCTQRVPGINPATCQPYRFVFVNNKSNSLGTFESPYPTLALAQANSAAGDIIYVSPGDGTTKGMNEGIALKLDQKFWGSAVPHSLQTTQGNIVIPAHSTTAPKMTNTNGYGITLAASNEISGFTITDTYDHGIYGTNLSNIEISSCTINNSAVDQIHLEYSSSYGSANLYDLTLTNGQNDAVYIDSTAPYVACTLKNSVIQGTGQYTINTSFANQANLSLVGNTIDNNINGTNLVFNGPASLLISDNTLSNTSSVSSFPILISANTDPLFATIAQNIIRHNTCGGMHIVLTDTDSAHLTITGNTISNNQTGSVGTAASAIVIDANNSTIGNCYLNVLDNQLSGNTSRGLYCWNGVINEFQINAIGNAVTDSGGGFVFAAAGNNFTLNATDNSIVNNSDNAIALLGSSGIITTANVTISNNQITGNTNSANGVAIAHDGSSDFNLTITKNNISNNEGSGITMYPSTPITNAEINIANNSINNNQNAGSNFSSGIDIHEYVNLSGTIANNRLSNNTDPSVDISTSDASPSVCLTMTGNSSDTGYTVDSGTGTFNLAPCNVDAVNTGTITTIGTITAVQSCPAGVPCP